MTTPTDSDATTPPQQHPLTPILGASHAHVGMVTNNLAEAKRRVTALLGLEWADDFDGALAPPFRSGDRQSAAGLVATNTSTGGPMRVELLQGQPNSVWATSELCRLHHVAYQVDDFDGCVDALLADGWRIELTLDVASLAPAVGFAYLVKDGEARIEITTR